MCAGKTLTPKVMAAVEQAFEKAFGPYCGWAHNTLFISELASQKHRLPAHLGGTLKPTPAHAPNSADGTAEPTVQSDSLKQRADHGNSDLLATAAIAMTENVPRKQLADEQMGEAKQKTKAAKSRKRQRTRIKAEPELAGQTGLSADVAARTALTALPATTGVSESRSLNDTASLKQPASGVQEACVHEAGADQADAVPCIRQEPVEAVKVEATQAACIVPVVQYKQGIPPGTRAASGFVQGAAERTRGQAKSLQ